MGAREVIHLKSVIKSDDPEELIVFWASSSKDEIRFYFNNEQYVATRDNYNGTFSIIYGEKKKVVKKNTRIKSFITKLIKIFRKDLKCFLILVFFISIIFLSIVVETILLLVGITIAIKSACISLLIVDLIYFLIYILIVELGNFIGISQSQKSKHSAEHMMVNFLEKKKRLPKNMSEIKKSSRFSDACGSRKEIENATYNFVMVTIIILLVNAINYITQSCKVGILLEIVVWVIFLAIGYGVEVFIKEYRKLDFIIKPINKLLNNVIQCANTTKYVEKNDIIMAYYAAREWIKDVYPEFYNKDEDTFTECEEN